MFFGLCGGYKTALVLAQTTLVLVVWDETETAPPTQTNKFTKFNLYSTYQSSNSNVAHTRDYKHHSAVKLAQMLRCYGGNTSYFTLIGWNIFPHFAIFDD